MLMPVERDLRAPGHSTSHGNYVKVTKDGTLDLPKNTIVIPFAAA